MACALCQRRNLETAATWQKRDFCAGCVRALGRLAANGSTEQRMKIWTVVSRDRSIDVTPEHMQGREEAAFSSMAGLTPDPPLSEVFADFTKGMKGIVGEADVDTHYDLGLAFREMGLHEDAIGEMGHVIQYSGKSGALAVVLDPRHLRDGLDGALRTLRELLFAN